MTHTWLDAQRGQTFTLFAVGFLSSLPFPTPSTPGAGAELSLQYLLSILFQFSFLALPVFPA